MGAAQFFPLGEDLELTQMERHEDQFVLHVTATSPSAMCPLCGQPATRLHSRYRRVVKDLPCVGQQVKLILYVRKFFCETAECVRKVFVERLPHLVAPWAQMTIRLNEPCKRSVWRPVADSARAWPRTWASPPPG